MTSQKVQYSSHLLWKTCSDGDARTNSGKQTNAAVARVVRLDAMQTKTVDANVTYFATFSPPELFLSVNGHSQ